MFRGRVFVFFVLAIAASASALGNVAPSIDNFVASPAVAAPGQAITLSLAAHDPDCATSCTTGCGLLIRGDLLAWSDNSGRTTSPFSNSLPGATASPWSATVTWVAPTTEGTYTISAQVNDNGGMLCGGKKTTVATLNVAVTNAQPPVIDSFTVDPQSLAVGSSATLTATAHAPAGGSLTYSFFASAGTVAQSSPSSNVAQWTAPQSAGTVTLRVDVSSGGTPVSAQTTATVQLGTFAGMFTLPGTRATRTIPLSDGRIAVVDGSGGTLQVVTPQGQVSWKAPGLATPIGVAESSRTLYVLERGASRISAWDRNGVRLSAFPLSAAVPTAITAGPYSGELTIADTASARLYVVSSTDGTLLRTIGIGSLAAPSSLACSNNRIAVADATAGKIVIFDAAGTVLKTLGDDTLLVRPQGLAWDALGVRLITADAFSGEVIVIGEEGVVRGTLAGFGTQPGQIVNPLDVTLLAGGTLLVSTAAGEMPMYQLLNAPAPVAPPTNVAAGDRTGDDGGAVLVTWTKSADDPSRVTAYLVERALGDSIDFAVVGRVAAGTVTFTDTPVTDGTCYHYRVAATDGIADSESLATGCAIARNDLAPAAPAAVSAVAISPFAINMTWAAVAAADLSRYDVTVTGGGASRVASEGAGATSATIDSLTPDTAYTIGVVAVDIASNASPSATASAKTLPDAAPATPTSVAAVDTTLGGEVAVTWTEPESVVPVSQFVVTATPATAGWPVVTATSTTGSARLTGLVNKLSYTVTVVAATSWGRTSAAATAGPVTPTVAPSALPIVDAVGWDGTTGIENAAGVTVEFTMAAPSRELRFEYRSSAAHPQVLVDGKPLSNVFPDTLGQWNEAAVVIDALLLDPTANVHTLELRNAAFPDPSAELAMRRIDFVPLPPSSLRVVPYNSVLDITWVGQEWRPDLTVSLVRSAASPIQIPCAAAETGLCRDVFLQNGTAYEYRFEIVSAAGWKSTSSIGGTPAFAPLPPPVTDVSVRPAGATRYLLGWTAVSTSLTEADPPAAVASYRVYSASGSALTLLGEAVSPSFTATQAATFVVHSVDSQGRESQ